MLKENCDGGHDLNMFIDIQRSKKFVQMDDGQTTCNFVSVLVVPMLASVFVCMCVGACICVHKTIVCERRPKSVTSNCQCNQLNHLPCAF